MSAQSAKKKRLGSRRRVANQNEISKPDEFHAADSAFVAEHHIPEEHTESLNALDNLDNSQSETHHPPSPELSGNRRKLGSSRRNKGWHVKDSATELYHVPREEVEDKTREKETTVTKQTPLAVQPERQEAASQGSEHDDISATHDSYVYLASTPDYSSEVQSATTTNYPEADPESLIPKDGNLQTELGENEADSEVVPDSCKLVETMQEGLDKYDILHSEEVKESAHLVGISERDQQLTDLSNFKEMQEEKLPNVCSVTEKEVKERDDNTELCRQDGNYLMSESHVESVLFQFSTTPEIIPMKISPTENTEVECSDGQTTISSPKEELSADEEQNEHFSLYEVRGAHQSEDAVNKQYEQEIGPTEMHDIDNSSESVIRDATENSEILSGNLTDQTEVIDTYQSELTEKSTDGTPTDQDISNPDNKQDEHPTKENNFEALEQKNEDYHVYETKEPQISDTETVDTALGQVYEIEGRVEDDIKPSNDQTPHQEKDGLFSKMEKSKSSLQTLQSEMNAPLDSQLEQNDTSFNPIGNRRKLGSSRRNRGRQHVKDSAAESYHEPTEDVIGCTKDNEPLETTEMSLIEKVVQEKPMETMLEGMDRFDTAQTEDVSDQVKENAHVGTVVGLDLSSSSTVDQQTIDQSHFREMPDEEFLNVCSVIEKENKERDEDTELFRQDGHLQTKSLVSEDIESSVTPEITTENVSSRKHTQPEYSVEQAIFSPSEEELPTNEGQKEISDLPEVKDDHHSEGAVNKLHEQEVKPTENQEMPQIDNSSESVIRDATENSEIISGNLTDQTEVIDTYQSELTEKSTDGSPTDQDISNPDNKQDEHPTKENNFEALEQKNEDYQVYETKEPQISDTETVDTALGQVYEIEGRVEDDIKPSNDQTPHQEKDGLFSKMEKSESSLQTLQSEINAPLDSQLQQNDISFNPIGNRRKLGSSRRNRGRQHVKDSAAESYHEHKDDAESTSGNEASETAQLLLATERTSQGELSQGSEHIIPTTHDSSLYSVTMTGYSFEVQSPTTTNYPEADLESFIPKSENLQEDHDERETHFKVEVSDKSVGATLEGSDKSDTLQCQEVKDDYHSKDAVNKLQVQTTENQAMPQIDNSSESVIRDATENSEILSGNLTDQTEVIDTYQSELTEKSTDGSPTDQDISNLDNKQDEHPTKENNFEALEQKNEDYHDYETKEPQISDTETVDTALGQVYEIEHQVEDDIKPSNDQTPHQEKDGLFSKMEETESSLQTLQSGINAPLDSQLQQNDISFNPIGNRRKLGSSRRNRGRQHVKDSAAESYHEPTEDVVGCTKDNEPLETTEMSLIEKVVQEKSMETMLEGMDRFDTAQTEDVSDQVKENAHVGTVVGLDLSSSSTVDQQTIDQSHFREMPDEEFLNVCSVIEKENKERDEDTELFRQDGHLQTKSLVSEDIESSVTPEITTENVSSRKHTQPEYSVEQAIFSPSEEELPTNEGQKEISDLPEVKDDHHSEGAVNKLHEQEVKPTENQEMPQIDNSSESVIRDATENSEIISGNLTDQTEVRDTYQSELTEKSTDGSPTDQDISNPDNKQDEHPTKENNFEALEQKNEDYQVYETKEPQISDTETVDTALGQVYEIEGRVEDDIKPSNDQTPHQEKDGLFSKMEKSESSLQTLQSEINAPLDSQLQQNDISFNPIGNRRKLGSSRRNRGRQHVKDSAAESYHEHKDDAESTSGNEASETAQLLLATERTSQGELSQGSEHIIPTTHDSSLYSVTMTGYSFEVQSPTTTNYPEADLESFIPKSENLQEDHDERETHFKVEVSDKSVGATLEGSDKSDTLQCQEVKDDYHSKDAVNKLQVQTTENQAMPQIDNSSESVIRDATENSEILSGNLTDQTEVIDTYQSELTEKSTDGSPTDQDISNLDNKQDEHPTKENNFEALEQKNEDYHDYETKEPQISDTETVDTALGQVYEIEHQVEDDIKPSNDQTPHQEKDGLFSEMEETESSLQTLQSGINAPLDSQLQQNDISFNPIGNRRKLGSSRRNRGRQHVKDSAAESYHEPTEDVVGCTKDNEPLETTEMSLIEKVVQEKSMETMLEGMDRFDTAQTEDVSDQVKENAHVGTVVGLDLSSSSTVDQQTIDQSHFREMPDEEFLNVCSVIEKENKERDEDTELFRQDGHLQTKSLVSEDIESSVTPEITTENVSSRKHTQPEYSVEQAIFSPSEEELPTNEGQKEISDLPEVKEDHHSEGAVNKLHEQEVKPTENQEMPQIDNSSESVIRDATENSEIISGNLTDQTEVRDTYQSELTEKSTDGSPTDQDISNPDNKQDEHPTKENNFEALEQKNEDYQVYETKEPQISDTETVDTALGQVYEIEGRVEDDIKPSNDQTPHQEKDGLFSKMEKSESSLQTLQSEINAPLDSQLQQNDISFNPIGNRRKLGSSRRNRGRQHVKDSAAESYHEHKDDAESTSGNEASETAQLLLATERTSQGELSQGSEHIIPTTHDSSLYSVTMTGYSFEVQSPTTTNYPEADLESFIPKSENLQEDHDERETHFKVEVSDKSVGATLEGSDKSDTLQCQEVKDDYHSKDAVNKLQVQTTENQAMPQIDNSSESVIRDATENSEILSGNLTDQTEVIDTYQSELTEKSTDGSPTDQDISNLDNKQDEHPTKENNFEALEQKNEDYHDYETKEPQISDTETVDTALGQVYEIEHQVEDDIKPSNDQTPHQEKDGLFSEMEETESSLQTLQSGINAPLDSQLQQNDISFNPIGNRRKLGSSRRNRGRQHVKDSAAESYHEPTEDVVGCTKDNEPLETTEMSLIEKVVQEKSMETMLEGMDRFDTAQTEDVSDQVKENAHVGTVVGLDLSSSSTVDQQTIDQSHFREMPDEEFLNVCSVIEKENKERDEDTELFRQDGHLQTKSLVSEDIESSVTPEITTENVSSRKHTQPEYSVEQAIFSPSEEELPTNEGQKEISDLPEVKDDHHSEGAVNKLHEQEVKPTENQEMPQIDNSSESVIRDATENSEIISGNLTDQTEVRDTYQSELTEKSTDGSPTDQDISNPDNKQDEHPTKENNFEALEQKNEDYQVYETKEPQISDTETVDTALGQVYEIEGRVEDDIKPSNDQTPHQEKDGLFSKMEKSESSLQTLQSEINAPLDSQLQQNDISFNPIGNRRKLGSSRRNRGRQHVKDSAAESYHEHKDDAESTSGNEASETAQLLLATERTSQGELSQGSEHIIPTTHDSSLYSVTMTGYSFEVQSPTTTNYPEADLESFIPKSENLQEDHDERETHFKVEVSDKSVGATLEGSDKSDTLQCQEVKDDYHSKDAVNKLQVQTTENQAMPQIDNSSESVIRDATENSEILSGNLTDQTEVIDTYQSELTEKSTDGSPTDQDISNLDNKQDEHPTKENNFEALEQKNEDYHDYETKEPQISDTETVDTALGQVYEIEHQVEDDIKPSNDQTPHQEKDGLFSEMEETESSLQTLQSGINAPLDSQLQQNDISFNPIGNRRKLGSSRRNRGRQHVKDSAAESYHEPTEDVVGCTKDNEPLETTEMSLIEKVVQEKSMETMLEGMDRFDTAQTEDVSDQVKENAHVGTVVGLDLSSSSTVDQQTIDQSHFREMPDEEFLNVCSVIEKENKERDEDTELFRQDGHLQTKSLVSEDIESSVTPEITTENVSSRKHTQPEYSVEQAIFSPSEEELPTNEGQKEISDLPEVKDDHHSEGAVNKLHEQEVKPTENQEMPQIDNSSESVIRDATENSEIISGNLTDQTEVRDTYQSELTEKSTDGSPTDQDISNPDNKQDEHPTKENNFEALEQKNEDYQVYETKEPQISDTETVDTALGQVYEIEGRVEDDIKPSNDQTPHQEKDGLFSKMEKSESSLQTLQSEINAPLDSQLQQNDISFNPIGNRRKLGSSRRNRGRQHVKDSAAESYHEHKDDAESTSGNEASETAQLLLATERTSQGELSQGREHIIPTTHDSSLYSVTMTGYSFEVQSPTTTNYPEADLESFIPKSENLQEDHDERETHFKVEVSDKSVGATLEGSDKSDTLQCQEVKDDYHSKDAVNKLQVKTTENQAMPQIDNSSESVIRDATENSEILSGNLTDQTEVIDTYQSELTEESTDGSPTDQDISNPDNKQDEHPTKENNFEALEQKNEDYHVYDTKEPQISDTETVDTALGQVYEIEHQVEDDIKPSNDQTPHQEKDGLFSEMEETESSLQTLQSGKNAPLDSQLQQNDISFNPIGNRRKLGSSRRNRGRQHVKDSAAESYHEPTEDVVGCTKDNEPLETTEMSLIEKVVQEKSMETMLEGMDRFDTAQTEDVSDQVKENAHVGTQERDEDTKSFNQDGNLQTNYLVSESHPKSEDLDSSVSPEVGSENCIPEEHTEIECSIEQAAFSSSNEKLSTNEERTEHVSLGALTSEDTVNKVHDDSIKPTQMQEMPQTYNSSINDSKSSLQTLQSENLDSQPLDHSQSIREQTHTGFNPTGNRRKLGSSRRHKGGLHVEDTTKMSLVMETMRQEELKEKTNLDFKFAGEIRSTVNNEENTEQMSKGDTILSQNLMDNCTTDITSSLGKDDFVKSNKEVNEEERKLIKDTENLSQLGCDSVKMDLIQSLDVSATTRLNASDVLEQDKAFQVQNIDALYCDKEMNMPQTNDTLETVEDVTKQDYKTEEESSIYGLDEDGEQFEDPTKKDHDARDMNVSLEITHAEQLSAAHTNTDTLAPFDIGLEENVQAEPAVDVSDESGISSQQRIQEQTNTEDSDNLQGRSKEKRRKLGSTRRTQLNRKPEKKTAETKDFNTVADMRSLDKMEVVEELTVTVTAEVSQNENAKPPLSPVDKDQQETISKALLPEQSASHKEEVVNPVKFVHITDARDSERNVEPSQTDFTATERKITSVFPGRNSIDPLLSTNTEDSTNAGITDRGFVSSCETAQSTQSDEERPESVNVTQDQALKSAEAPVVADFEIVKSAVRGGAGEEHMSAQTHKQEPDDATEGAHIKHPEMKNASPNLDSTNRRRKMGSSRRNLRPRTKQEGLDQKQEVDDEATETETNVGDVTTESVSGNIHSEHKDSEQRKEKVSETVAYIHTDESHQTFKENPVSHGQLVETEHQLTPSYRPSTPSSSPRQDSMSESSPGGRRRKMGSHRKSSRHQNHENQTARADRITSERDIRSITDESANKATEELRERSLGLDKILEVDQSDKKPSSNISTAKLSRPVSEKTTEPVSPVQRPYAEISLGQESQHKFSLAGNSRSKTYNVMMVGDSCVGKTSFMKRAQSGKFSLDLPASVGLDSCMWTVVVNGKHVVLQLWDTAGQERFHSITRQIFHKAHAFLLMYDITSSQSFSAVSYWASCIQEGAAENVTILLVGNKRDRAERQVNTQEAEALAKEYNFEFMECSAATGENVLQCLETVARMLSQKADTREETMVLHKEPQQRKSGCC